LKKPKIKNQILKAIKIAINHGRRCQSTTTQTAGVHATPRTDAAEG
jgi:hypothetical protein